MAKLWLDDVRPPPDDTWKWARTNARAKALLTVYTIEEASLDHDMGFVGGVEIPADATVDEMLDIIEAHEGEQEETGYELVNWMIENECVPERITIHSWNPAGAQAMAARLNYHGYDCVVAPFVA